VKSGSLRSSAPRAGASRRPKLQTPPGACARPHRSRGVNPRSRHTPLQTCAPKRSASLLARNWQSSPRPVRHDGRRKRAWTSAEPTRTLCCLRFRRRRCGLAQPTHGADLAAAARPFWHPSGLRPAGSTAEARPGA